MSNQCIKTGAFLWVEPYGFGVPADLYEVGHCIVARINGRDSYQYSQAAHDIATHKVNLDVGPDFYREDLGIIVIHHTQIEEL